MHKADASPFGSILLVYSKILGLRSKCKQEVSRHFEAKPAAGHAWCDFQKIWYNAFVHAPNTFLGDDHSDGVEYSFVLVSHARHGVNLKATSKHITNIG